MFDSSRGCRTSVPPRTKGSCGSRLLAIAKCTAAATKPEEPVRADARDVIGRVHAQVLEPSPGGGVTQDVEATGSPGGLESVLGPDEAERETDAPHAFGAKGQVERGDVLETRSKVLGSDPKREGKVRVTVSGGLERRVSPDGSPERLDDEDQQQSERSTSGRRPPRR